MRNAIEKLQQEYAELFEGKEIRETEDGKFSVYDYLTVVTGYKNPREIFKRLCEQYPEVRTITENHKFPGRGQHETPVTNLLGLSFISKLLKSNDSKLHLESDVYIPRTEKQINKVLIEVYKDEQPCEQFYCEGYRIDLYLAKPRIAIECDEREHSCYNKKKELKREQLLRKSLGCSFVRFNPYVDKFNIGNVIYKVNQLLYKPISSALLTA